MCVCFEHKTGLSGPDYELSLLRACSGGTRSWKSSQNSMETLFNRNDG